MAPRSGGEGRGTPTVGFGDNESPGVDFHYKSIRIENFYKFLKQHYHGVIAKLGLEGEKSP